MRLALASLVVLLPSLVLSATVTEDMVRKLEEQILEDPLRWGDVKRSLAFLDLTRLIRLNIMRINIQEKVADEKKHPKGAEENEGVVETYLVVAGMVKFLDGGEKAFTTDIVDPIFDEIHNLFEESKERIKSSTAEQKEKDDLTDRIEKLMENIRSKCSDQNETQKIKDEFNLLVIEIRKACKDEEDSSEDW